ncbi:TBC domain-containing protein like [Verticillium longisporum]|nr:TBC domain-containing protein like [Verticillium longisporum]
MTTTTATSDTALETASQTTTTPSIRLLSPEAEKDSQKVRSLYESGDVINGEDGGRLSPLGEQHEPVPSEELENDPVSELQPPPAWPTPRSATSSSSRPEQQAARREHERAGGIEDWEDIENADVDRYGFIAPPRNPDSRVDTPTELKSAQYAPRRRNLLIKRDPSGGLSNHLGAGGRSPSRKVSARSLNTQNSGLSVRSRRSTRSAIRQASNYLPHNRNRRWMDEAGDMLTLAPGMEDEEKVEKISEAIKKKEWERSEKWRKMAKVVKQGKDGEGMYFEFDVKNPKLIERTWKGIPDRWRASAWYSFLATSARARKDSAPEEDIIAAFRRYQDLGSPDDVQIDLDVPRTINRHIMFRRRYRGGQRLLFRVLHALSLYFPDVGYVQGMASLAATLLCYFDEEKCFVMLVRMWQLRGLEALYQPGFEGLMGALREFETQWLGGKDVARKLTDLCIDPTAYGTRWYLTLFNLSIPFQAQLRVWDVFLLLGEAAPEQRPMTAKSAGPPSAALPVMGIDIVHATSAALISALGEVLLDSDFENAMKALTSWIPIKDEDLLMKVTKAEWRAQQGKKRA